MAIKQVISIQIQVLGDGTSTSFSVNLENHIKQTGVSPLTPSSVWILTESWGVGIASSSLAGSTLTVNLNSAPPATEANVGINLLF